jgi:hypothetical protein
METAHFLMFEAVMSIIDDSDCDELICRLTGPLPAPDRVAFRRAAEDALARVPCWGEGAVYRAVTVLQRKFFDPPTLGRARWDIGQTRPSRLKGCSAARMRRRWPRFALPQTETLSRVPPAYRSPGRAYCPAGLGLLG